MIKLSEAVDSVVSVSSSSVTLSDHTEPIQVETDFDVFTRVLSHSRAAQKIVNRSFWEANENDFINAIQSLGFEHSIEIIAPSRTFHNPSTGTEIFDQQKLSVFLKKNDQIVLHIIVIEDHDWINSEESSSSIDFTDQLKDL
jgi:hypothetical protein